MSKVIAPFLFPPFHSFPPFFTLQPVESTAIRQRAQWTELIRAYATHYKLTRFSLHQYATSSAAVATSSGTPAAAASSSSGSSSLDRDSRLINTLFRNDAIHRQSHQSKLILDVAHCRFLYCSFLSVTRECLDLFSTLLFCCLWCVCVFCFFEHCQVHSLPSLFAYCSTIYAATVGADGRTVCPVSLPPLLGIFSFSHQIGASASTPMRS